MRAHPHFCSDGRFKKAVEGFFGQVSMENEKSPQRLYVWENIPSLSHLGADKVPLSDSVWPSLPHLTRGPGDLLRDLDNQARCRPGWWHCKVSKNPCAIQV